MSDKATKIIIGVLVAAVIVAGSIFALKTLGGGDAQQQLIEEQMGDSMPATTSAPAASSAGGDVDGAGESSADTQ